MPPAKVTNTFRTGKLLASTNLSFRLYVISHMILFLLTVLTKLAGLHKAKPYVLMQ